MLLSPVVVLMLAHSALSLLPGHNSCSNSCLAGFYAHEVCSEKPNLTQTYKCKRCPEDSFTELPNTAKHCQRCSTCQENQEETQACVHDRNTQCVCLKGYYQETQYSGLCKPCVNDCKGHDHCMARCPTVTVTTTTFQAPKENSSVVQTPNKNRTEENGFSVTILLIVLLTSSIIFILTCTWICLTTSRKVCLIRKKDLELPCKDPQLNAGNPKITSVSIFQADQTSCSLRASTTHSEAEHVITVTPLLPNLQAGIPRQESQPDRIPATVLYAIIKEVPLRRWKEFLRLLAVPERQLERVELEACMVTGSLERQYLMLRLWSQRPAATMEDVYSALQYMELGGCAQQLQSSLDTMQWCTGAGRLVTQPVMSPQLPRTREMLAVNTKL